MGASAIWRQGKSPPAPSPNGYKQLLGSPATLGLLAGKGSTLQRDRAYVARRESFLSANSFFVLR